MSGQLALIHTVPGLIATFGPLVQQHLPDWTPFNIADESLLRISIREGSMSKATARRVAGYVFSALDAGADAILVTCSSIGDAVDAVRPLCPVPLLRVDEGMAARAVEIGQRIGVLATLSTTLNPTRDLVGRLAAARPDAPKIVARVCDGAFEALSRGDGARHDALVREGIDALSREVDVILLAQASMARVLKDEDGAPGIPVLSSPELGVLRLKAVLAGA
ncbi:MAG: Asp/Glu/hydantoin racemase [Rhizobiales bacterium]|nr:Asp/Glu/hydantoin racemase [Hyphomicrobiales bacterium]